MSLQRELGRIHQQYWSQVRNLLDFIHEIDAAVTRGRDAARFPRLSKKGAAEFDKLTTLLRPAMAGAGEPKARMIVSGKLGAWLLSQVASLQARGFLGEMSLAYLISYQEAFLKDYLKAILCDRKVMLKSSRTISYEEVCSHISIEELIADMAQKEVDSLGFGNIDDFAAYFERKFKLKFEHFPAWPDLREAAYRRNLILHGSGITNAMYCLKTGYSKCGARLVTEPSYVCAMARTLLRFMAYVHRHIRTKFKMTT